MEFKIADQQSETRGGYAAIPGLFRCEFLRSFAANSIRVHWRPFVVALSVASQSDQSSALSKNVLKQSLCLERPADCFKLASPSYPTKNMCDIIPPAEVSVPPEMKMKMKSWESDRPWSLVLPPRNLCVPSIRHAVPARRQRSFRVRCVLSRPFGFASIDAHSRFRLDRKT
jgi:hypothetical protein